MKFTTVCNIFHLTLNPVTVSTMKFTELFSIVYLFLTVVFSLPTSLRGSEIDANINKNINENIIESRILMPGGWSEIQHPNSDADIVAIAEWAGMQIFPNQQSSVNIISAERQVVAGMNYR